MRALRATQSAVVVSGSAEAEAGGRELELGPSPGLGVAFSRRLRFVVVGGDCWVMRYRCGPGCLRHCAAELACSWTGGWLTDALQAYGSCVNGS